MKKLIKILLLVMACVLLFAACEDKDGGATTTTDPNNGVPPATPLVLVNADRSTNYSVVIPNSATSEYRAVVRDFINSMKTKTNASAKMALVQDNTTPTNDFEITINVTKHRDDAAAAYAATPYNSAKIEIVGNRIVVSAYTDTSLEAALDDLIASIAQNEAGNWELAPTYSYHVTNTIVKSEEDWDYMSAEQKEAYNAYIAELTALPKYRGENLTTYEFYPLAHDAYEIAFGNTTKAEYDAYVASLEAAGFVKYSERTISAGSDKPNECNLYQIFTKDHIYVSTSWQGNLDLARIVTSLPTEETLPSLEPIPAQSTHTVTPTVTQMHITGGSKLMGGGGMSYVIQLADGKFIIVDGGVPSNFSEDILIEYLEAKAAEAGMEKPVIAMWFFSHPHGDHIGLALGSNSPGFFATAKTRGYTIESIAYNFANDLALDAITGDLLPDDTVKSDDMSGQIWSFEFEIRRNWPNAKIYTPRAGQVFYFTGMQLEILTTEEDTYPLLAQSTHNGFCINWRMTFDNGKTFMFLADSTPGVNEQLARIYGDYLKSDVLQMAHHGLTGAEINSYRFIDPDICLWPTTEIRFSGMYAEPDKTVFQSVQHTMGMIYQDGDTLGNPTKGYTSAPEGIANRWIRALGEFSNERQRQHYHNSQTTIVNVKDMTVSVDKSHTEVWD